LDAVIKLFVVYALIEFGSTLMKNFAADYFGIADGLE